MKMGTGRPARPPVARGRPDGDLHRPEPAPDRPVHPASEHCGPHRGDEPAGGPVPSPAGAVHRVPPPGQCRCAAGQDRPRRGERRREHPADVRHGDGSDHHADRGDRAHRDPGARVPPGVRSGGASLRCTDRGHAPADLRTQRRLPGADRADVGAAWAAWTQTLALTAGDVVMLSSYFITLTGSATALMSLAPIVSKGLESVRSMGEVLTEPDIEANAPKRPLADVRGTVEFDHVQFAYDDAPDIPVVQDVTFRVDPGETVALVGPSGSGKSTMLNMVIGFLHPQQGAIRIDGQDLVDLDLRTYRRFLAVVPQESILFEGSVRDNVTYGNPDLDDDAVRSAPG